MTTIADLPDSNQVAQMAGGVLANPQGFTIADALAIALLRQGKTPAASALSHLQGIVGTITDLLPPPAPVTLISDRNVEPLPPLSQQTQTISINNATFLTDGVLLGAVVLFALWAARRPR
jgi:hypothetical protein